MDVDLERVPGRLHLPARPRGDGLVLTHGAGSNADAPLLVAVAREFAARDVTVFRYDLPFRQARPRGAPSPGTAPRDREGLAAAVEALRKRVDGRVFLGGSSYGGRQASMLLADSPGLVAGLLLLSYPLHPPGRPTQQRTTHLPKLRTPSLFVHGSRDPFGSLPDLGAALELIPAPTHLLTVDGVGHDLAPALPDLASRVAAAFCGLMQTRPAP